MSRRINTLIGGRDLEISWRSRHVRLRVIYDCFVCASNWFGSAREMHKKQRNDMCVNSQRYFIFYCRMLINITEQRVAKKRRRTSSSINQSMAPPEPHAVRQTITNHLTRLSQCWTSLSRYSPLSLSRNAFFSNRLSTLDVFKLEIKKKSELSFLVSQNDESADVAFYHHNTYFSILIIMLFLFIYLRSDGNQLQLDALSRVPRMASTTPSRNQKEQHNNFVSYCRLSGERAREAINIEEITITS